MSSIGNAGEIGGTQGRGEGSGIAPRFVDHPAPSAPLMVIHFLVIAVLAIGAVPEAVRSIEQTPMSFLPIVIVGLILCTLVFYLWPFFQTQYVISAQGILVRYGPWRRQYDWSEFSGAYSQRGLFSMRIGWPSVTPCVRMTDAVILSRRTRRYDLYLTPNESRAFLVKIGEFAPDLLRETIL